MKSPAAPAFTACTVSWVVLLALTTISFELGAGAPGRALTAAVLALTLIRATWW